ncbi:hypothetical protein KY084_02920 [Stakelama sp. CBK3Z-3]|uniref:DUF3617 family protein n=1 Tax=Stakelama flava TaxID=2860338 RepID=A0ABS6XHZ4_9SPHN|nr:hypothetical protein [Stakelama flava]MBW4329827.1 hypothetical protein [Stakelama flava]
MSIRLWSRLSIAALLPLMAAAGTPKSGLAVIDALEAGKWQLTEQGKPDGFHRTVCLPDKVSLIQVVHPGAQCSRFVIDNQPRTGTVHYTCPGDGHGRTTLRLETPRRVEIDTQGMWDGLPFKTLVDARKVGTCRAR